MSGIGKGVATSSIGIILKSKGYTVTAIKIDPYINVDAGTMNPVEHGEVFVTDDGAECDQDIGNYERFLGENIYNDNYMTIEATDDHRKHPNTDTNDGTDGERWAGRTRSGKNTNVETAWSIQDVLYRQSTTGNRSTVRRRQSEMGRPAREHIHQTDHRRRFRSRPIHRKVVR